MRRSSLFNVGLYMRVATVRCDRGSRAAIIVVQCGIAYEGVDGEVRSG